ncbi:alpha-L-rhamnosidase [Puteibacter caeruleilacunae]|nr:alpha-L-rhamnosidase [Puteibacter caeruleilacunae]
MKNRHKYIALITLFLVLLNLLGQAQSNEIKSTYLAPTRIVWQSDESGVQLKNTTILLEKGIHQADLYGGNYCTLERVDGKNAAIILDFGKEIQGGIQLVTAGFSGKDPINIRLRFGESVSETMSDVGEHGATNEHSMRDFNTQLPWMGKMEVGSTGFRFVRIDLIDTNRKLLLKEVCAVSQIRDIPYVGSFECDDERLNSIWQTGAYTVHLNMQEYLWDGIKRDRLVWVGDMHPEVMTINSVFGYNEVVPKSLDYIKKVTPTNKWMNGISSYTMWWILIQHDWYMAHGDLAYLKQQHDYLKELLSRLCSKVGDDGAEKLDGTRFLDWPTSRDQTTIKQGYQALLKQTLQAGVQMSEWLKDKETKTLCENVLKRMVKVEFSSASSKQAAALMCLAELLKADEAAEVIKEGEARGFSTFYGYYMLEALAKSGDYQVAMEIIKDYWGGMLDLGATTFWEDFHIDWLKNAGRIDEVPSSDKVDVHRKYGDFCYKYLRHSFCHGWASGPTAWLSNHVLGVQVLEPGCSRIKITPHLGDLKWVKGTYPTPMGVIEIMHEKRTDGTIKTTVKAPKGVKVEK